LKPVELNGYPQWLLIRGQDVSKPVLLYLHGGPGEPNMWLAHYTMKELEQHFVCVNWDQRGAGRSLRPGPNPATMTIEQFVNDTIALIELLLARFGQKKLFPLGHSWGSTLAMKVGYMGNGLPPVRCTRIFHWGLHTLSAIQNAFSGKLGV
jgi:pimeloyl-ACP methyl ester carboxylesterase